MRSPGSRSSRVTRQQAAQWADKALAQLGTEVDVAGHLTLTEVCERAWRQAAIAWVEAEQRRTGKLVEIP